MRRTRGGSVFAAALSALVIGACSDEHELPEGALILVLSTNLEESFDQVKIGVQPGTHSRVYELAPCDALDAGSDGLILPATVALPRSDYPTGEVTITVEARRAGVRTLFKRTIRTTIPAHEVRELPVPIDERCSIDSRPQCAADVDSSQLPLYSGDGARDAGKSCFVGTTGGGGGDNGGAPGGNGGAGGGPAKCPAEERGLWPLLSTRAQPQSGYELGIRCSENESPRVVFAYGCGAECACEISAPLLSFPMTDWKFTAGEWFHIAVTYELAPMQEATVILYVDGVARDQARANLPGKDGNAGELRVGARPSATGGGGMDGAAGEGGRGEAGAVATGEVSTGAMGGAPGAGGAQGIAGLVDLGAYCLSPGRTATLPTEGRAAFWRFDDTFSPGEGEAGHDLSPDHGVAWSLIQNDTTRIGGGGSSARLDGSFSLRTNPPLDLSRLANGFTIGTWLSLTHSDFEACRGQAADSGKGGAGGTSEGTGAVSDMARGYIDDIAVFDRALIDSEVEALRMGSYTRLGLGECRWAAFDEGTSSATWLSADASRVDFSVSDHGCGLGGVFALLDGTLSFDDVDRAYFRLSGLSAATGKLPADALQFSLSGAHGQPNCTWQLSMESDDLYEVDLTQPSWCRGPTCSVDLAQMKQLSVATSWRAQLGDRPLTLSEVVFAKTRNKEDVAASTLASAWRGRLDERQRCWKPVSYDPNATARWQIGRANDWTVVISGEANTNPQVAALIGTDPVSIADCTHVLIDAPTTGQDCKAVFELRNERGETAAFGWDKTDSLLSLKNPGSVWSPNSCVLLESEPWDRTRIVSLAVGKYIASDNACIEGMQITLNSVRFCSSENRDFCDDMCLRTASDGAQ